MHLHGQKLSGVFGKVFLYFFVFWLKMQKNNIFEDKCLYPRHLCRGVYSFRPSVCPFVRLYVRLFVRSFVRTSVTFVEFASKFCVKVSQMVYISATTYQNAFIFGP